MKKLRMKTTTLDFLNAEIRLYCGQRKLMEEEAKNLGLPRLGTELYGACYDRPIYIEKGKPCFIMWVSRNNGQLIIHEGSHLVDAIFDYTGMDDGELRANLMDYIYEKFV